MIKIDLTQFHQTFFEETAEHLAEMERLLVTLDLDAPDSESLNGIFRAAHSIKGGAGIFGFTDMIGVTHAAESLLDKIRSGKLPLLPVMVDAFLATGDLLNRLLGQHRGGLPTDEADAAESQRLTVVLEDLTANALAGVAASTSAAVATEAVVVEKTASESDDSFGLFEPMTDDSFGLFEEPVAVAAKDESFGLFEEPVVATAADDSFGLFEEVAQPATAPIDAGQSVAEPAVAEPAVVERSAVEKGTAAASAPSEQPSQKSTTPASVPAASRAPVSTESSSIRVSVEKADQLINLVGELVITQAMLAQLTGEFDPVRHEKLHEALVQFERNTRELQEAAMSMRMLPVGSVFSRFPRVVRDTTAKLGKQVDLILEGESTELDKGLIEKLADPLTHLVRNAIDHGIEMPDERIAAGKSPKGRVVLSAYHHGGNVVIQIVDDGHGLSRDRILAKARERGFNVSDDMADSDVWQLIFEPGFSTAAVVTDISGRGVGMDVVRRNIQAMNGRIEIESFAGIGSRFTVWLPLTLAILEGMLLSVDSDTYVVPLTNIIESLLPEPGTINTVATQGRVIRVRGDYLPIASLRDLLSLPAAPAEVGVGIVLLLESEGKKFALQVDELLGQSQVVIKSLENNYKRVAGFAGATILGNGRVAMILDVDALRRMTLSPPPAASSVLQSMATVNP